MQIGYTGGKLGRKGVNCEQARSLCPTDMIDADSANRPLPVNTAQRNIFDQPPPIEVTTPLSLPSGAIIVG
jgi:hypothetical protein